MMGSFGKRSTITPANSPNKENGSASSATSTPISNGEARRTSAAVDGRASVVIWAPKCVIVSEPHNLRKSWLRHSPVRQPATAPGAVICVLDCMFTAPITALWAALRYSPARQSGGQAISAGPDARVGAAEACKLCGAGRSTACGHPSRPDRRRAMARPNQSLTLEARTIAPGLRSIETCGMAFATKAPPARAARLLLAVMSWRLMVLTNPGRRWWQDYTCPAPNGKDRGHAVARTRPRGVTLHAESAGAAIST